MHLKLKVKSGFLVFLSMACIFIGYTMDRNAKASGKWQPTTGKVLSSQVIEEERPHRKGTRIEYNPLVSYEYESPHGVIRNDRMTYSGPAMKTYRFQAEKLADQYKPGMSVTVYYNPDNPRQSCLKPGRTRDGIVIMVMGALLLLGVLLFFIFRSLDRYAGLGEFSHIAVNKKTEGIPGRPTPYEETEAAPSILHEYIVKAKESPLIIRHLETHLFFGPIYRGTPFGEFLSGVLNLFPGKRFPPSSVEEQLLLLFLVTKIFLGGLAALFVFMAPFLFLMKAPDARADLLLGLIWLPGLEFIPKLTPNQKYITICRLFFTIPVIYLGINSGNWGW
jgi:hypothetical protein